jgi:hypothetical protein
MAFDAKEYRARVLGPFKNQRLTELQAGLRELKAGAKAVPASLDIVELYDMSVAGSDAVVASQVESVSDTFNKCLNAPSFDKIGPTLVEIHKLLTSRNAGFSSAAFWQARLAERSQRAKQKLAEFADIVATDSRVLQLVTTTRLATLATKAGVAGLVPQAEIEAAVKAAGIEVVPPVRAPTVSVPTAVLSELRKTSCASVVDAIFLQEAPKSFTVVDGFLGSQGERISLAAVGASRRTTERRPSNDDQNAATQKVLGALERLSDDRELEEVVLAYFVEIGRQAAQAEPALALALKRLTGTRLDRRDAARILTLYSDGRSGAGFPEVQQKVVTGLLKDARRLFDALCSAAGSSAPEARADAQAVLEGAERRVAELRVAAQAALQRKDTAAAAAALNEALAICTDDEALTQVQAALPPLEPVNLVLTAGPGGRTVLAVWGPRLGAPEDIRYVVVRKRSEAPRNVHDGLVLARGLSESRFEDPAPEIATPVYYAVAATKGASSSPLVSASITLVPPVTGARAKCAPDSISLSWDLPVGARAVRVVQVGPDGRQSDLVATPRGQATSSGLTSGATYTFFLTALYAGPVGEVAAPPCRVTATPRGEAAPVPFVNLRQVAGPVDSYELDATWKAVTGFEVEIWSSRTKPPWTYGARVAMARISAEAERLVGPRTVGTAREGIRAAVRPGLRHYFAVTRDGDTGVVGQSNEVGICPRLADITAERFNDVVLLSWVWPGDDFDVHVRWEGQSGTGGARRVTFSGYRSEGGLRVAAGPDGARFRLQVVPAASGEMPSSPETVVDVAGAPPCVHYTTLWHKRPFRPPHAVTLRFACDEHLATVPIVVTAQPGQVMPYAKESGVVLAEKLLDLSTTGTAALTLPLKGLGPHFWVRAFPQRPDEVRLVDPPSVDLRGA